jgi:hypothetical protein
MGITNRRGGRARWALAAGAVVLLGGGLSCAAAGTRPANASVVIVARGMLEGQLTPIG